MLLRYTVYMKLSPKKKNEKSLQSEKKDSAKSVKDKEEMMISTPSNIGKEELEKALFNVDDLMDRLNIPYVLLGKVAYAAKHDRFLEGDKITVGVRATEILEERKNMILTVVPTAKISEKKIEYEFEGVPIEIKIISRKYDFIRFPDSKV